MQSRDPVPSLFTTLIIVVMVTATSPLLGQSEAKFAEQRQAMVARQLAGRDIDDPLVLKAIGTMPRHRFVPADERRNSYADRPLPIGYGQTISQPYIVAYMCQEAGIDAVSRVNGTQCLVRAVKSRA